MTILVQQQLRDLLGNLTTAFWRNDGALVCPAYRDGETVYVESWRPVAEAASTDYARFIAAANPTNVLALLDEIDRITAENAELIGVVQAYESARDSLFVQCLSNPIKNAWGKQVDVSLLNKAHEQARKIINACQRHREQAMTKGQQP